MDNPKYAIGQQVKILDSESTIFNGLQFAVTDVKRRKRKVDGVEEYAYTGYELDDVYVSEELLVWEQE